MYLLLASVFGHLFLHDLTSGLYNAALYKPAVQSSTWSTFGPSLAVDGSSDGNFINGHCIHTNNEFLPWWMVDLMGQFVVDTIILSNRLDCCDTRLRDFQIDIFDQDPRKLTNFPNVTGNICYKHVSALTSSPLKTACPSPITGRFVRLLLNLSSPGLINVCEIEVLVSDYLYDGRLFSIQMDIKYLRSALDILTVSDSASCVQECLARRSSTCTAFNWVTTSKTCLLFIVNPSLDLKPYVTSAPGTHFYIQVNSFGGTDVPVM